MELGAGFDKEYTGRENIYLYGAVLGYSKEFIDSKFDEIVKFSGLKKFLDVPLKNYSSGMKSRLGFSIATIVEPEILILDEVLSVGDAKFRKKSEKKILSMMDKGVTVLFVSHSLEQVKRICTKAVILENGSIRSIGDIDTDFGRIRRNDQWGIRKDKIMIYGAMLAGGVGSRMKSAVIPKQFLEVDGKPIIIYTLQNMLKVDRFDYIYIATHKDYLAYMKEMVQKYTDKPEKVRIIEGGKERMDSIHNVTDAILKDEGVHEDDVIVIHDAVRPLVTEKILNDSIDAAGTYGACVCGLPAVDTMLYSEDGKVVTTIPERSKLFNGQAPDSFSLPRFLEMQANLTEEQREVITGTSQICTMNNQPIYIIEGDPLNFKLTTDGDLLIFKSIIDDQTV